MITNPQAGTNIHEIADGIYRINTPIDFPDGQGFSFNQYLLLDDEPLLFHTGPRRMFPLVREAIAAVMPIERLRYVGLSHFEADECGAMNELLAAAPAAVPLCGQIAAMVSVERRRRPGAARAGRRRAARARPPHGAVVRHAARAARLGLRPADGDVDRHLPLRRPVHPARPRRPGAHRGRHPRPERSVPPADGLLRARAADDGDAACAWPQQKPRTLACMHGSAWRGDGGALLRHLAEAVSASR